MEITPDEIKVLTKWLESQTLPYDNWELREIVDKICRASYELDRKSSTSTQGG